MIYFISDTHFGHRNIIPYCNRPFSSVDEMNEVIINNWNQKVTPEDTVYFLGDFAFNQTRDSYTNLRKRLNGVIHLVLGNHDRVFGWTKELYASISRYKVIEASEGIKILLAHHPLWRKDPYKVLKQTAEAFDICLYGHCHNKIYDDEPSNYICVSLENWNYTPIALSDIENRYGPLAQLVRAPDS